MSKMSDFLKKATDKKKGIHHPEADDTPMVEKKAVKQRAPVIGKKPPTRSAGRGRWLSFDISFWGAFAIQITGDTVDTTIPEKSMPKWCNYWVDTVPL